MGEWEHIAGRDTVNANAVAAVWGVQRTHDPTGRPMVIDDAGQCTPDQVRVAVATAAGELRRRGVRAGDRVAIMLRPGRAWLRSLLGIMSLGAIAVPIDPGDDDARIAMLCAEVGAHVAIAERPLATRSVSRLAPDELDAGYPLHAQPVDPLACALILFTSGSTGRPKGVTHTHAGLARAGYVSTTLGVATGDRVHSPSAGFSALGLFIGVIRPLMAGATVVFSSHRTNVRSVVRTVRHGGVTVLAAVPTLWTQLAEFIERHPNEATGLQILRHAVASGEPCPPALVRRVRRALGLDLRNGFGSAECGDIVIAEHPSEGARGGVGQPVEGVTARLESGPAGSAAGGTGRLLVRCPTATAGYWDRPEGEQPFCGNGWLQTDDIMSTRDGVYVHHGRCDRAITVGGRLVHTADAEACLCEHPAVLEAVVVTTPGRRAVTEPVMFVRVAGTPIPDLKGELRALLATRMGRTLQHARLTTLDGLPRLASGKVDRQALRERAAA